MNHLQEMLKKMSNLHNYRDSNELQKLIFTSGYPTPSKRVKRSLGLLLTKLTF
jgi:hypothetical protein